MTDRFYEILDIVKFEYEKVRCERDMLRNEAAESQTLLVDLYASIDNGGFERGLCRSCGKPMVYLVDDMVQLCRHCAEGKRDDSQI